MRKKLSDNKFEILDFFKIIYTLKVTPRQGWIDKKIMYPETIGSHCFGAALIGWYFAQNEKANTSKIIKMLLVHNLAMAATVDITPRHSLYGNREKIRCQAFKSISTYFPKSVRSQFSCLYKEFLDGKTKESIIAQEANKIDTILQAKKYDSIFGKAISSEFMQEYKSSFLTDTGNNMYRQIGK